MDNQRDPMNREEKRVRIVEPSARLRDIRLSYERIIAAALPSAKLHHIGSSAVPIAGREEIDILVETDDIVQSQETLARHGFSKGPINHGEAFLRGRQYPILCDVHVLQHNDKRVGQYLTTIKRLQEDTGLRTEYERLRRSLDGKTEQEYKTAKRAFLKERLLDG